MTMHRILIANDEDNIVVNIVYRETEGEIVGEYSGNSGGGVFDMRFFHLNEDNEATVSDDSDEIELVDENFGQEDFDSLESERAKFENAEDDGVLSEEGLNYLSDVESENGVKVKYSESASEDVIYDIQDEWTLNYFLD